MNVGLSIQAKAAPGGSMKNIFKQNSDGLTSPSSVKGWETTNNIDKNRSVVRNESFDDVARKANKK